jgi:hypothetical protein
MAKATGLARPPASTGTRLVPGGPIAAISNCGYRGAMRRGLVWLGCASVLALGCGDDSAVTPEGESSSGEPETTTGTPATTAPMDGSSSGAPDGSSSSGSSGDEATTSMPESSTGPVEACGNDAVEGDEACDGTDLAGQDCVGQGFDGGELGCAADCSALDTSGCMNFACGNNVAEGKEACDGNDFGGATCQSLGFDSGTLSCALNCGAFDTDECGLCGNVIVDGDEVCDDFLLFGQTCVTQGYSSGQLGCMPDCLSYDFSQCIQCGNDVIDGIEPCDGVDFGGATCATEGFVGGTLACTPDCGLDTSGCNACGNAIVDSGEGCDGANLNGQTCASLGLSGGTLACAASCQFDFSGCDIAGIPFGSDTGYNGYDLSGAPLPCDDIVATGTPTLLTDDSNLVVPIGFSFPFYGVDYTDANIESNGVLRFGDNMYLTYNNTCLPSATAPSNNNLYVFWDDLSPSVAGASEVYYQTLGPVGNQRFVVQWETAHYGGDGVDLIRVQAMLDEASGQISVCYPDTLSLANVGNDGAEATSGIQQNNANGFNYSCNTPDLVNGTYLLYIPL